MILLKRGLKWLLNKFGYELIRAQKFDYTNPFNVPIEWIETGIKLKTPNRIVIGGGDCNYGPMWHNIEYVTQGYAEKYKSLPKNIDIPHDLTALKPFGIEDASIEAAYTSHVIEHLHDNHVAFLFGEVYRVLNAKGVFRITCPDIDLYIRAFLDKDLSFFHYRNHPHYVKTEISDSVCGMFLDVFATKLSERMEKITYTEVFESIEQKGIVPTLNFYSSQVSYSKEESHYHVNWFNYEKLKNMLNKAGFTNIRISGVGQSYFPDMRNLSKFDTQDFKISLFVECTK